MEGAGEEEREGGGRGQIPMEGRRLSEKSQKFPQKLPVSLKVQFYHKNS